MLPKNDSLVNPMYNCPFFLLEARGGYGEFSIGPLTAHAPLQGSIVIVGRNGSGKSTLLKMIAGLMPFDGDILVGGGRLKDLTCTEAAQRRSYLPQSGQFPQGYRVRDVLSLAQYQQQDPAKALALCHHLGLIPYLSHFACQLSGGLQQLLRIAYVLLQPGQLLLLDEPFSFLDTQRVEIVSWLLNQEMELGRCVCLVAHGWLMDIHLPGYLWLLEEGQLRISGPVEASRWSQALKRLWAAPFP